MNITINELLNALLLISGISAMAGVLIKNDTLTFVGLAILILSGVSLGYRYSIELDDAVQKYIQLDNNTMSDPDRLVLMYKTCSNVFLREECLNRLEKRVWKEP